MCFHKLHRFLEDKVVAVGQLIGGNASTRRIFIRDDVVQGNLLLPFPKMGRIVIVSMPLVEVTKKMIKAFTVRSAGCARLPQPPLSHQGRLIPSRFQEFREDAIARLQWHSCIASDTCVPCMQSRHENRA